MFNPNSENSKTNNKNALVHISVIINIPYAIYAASELKFIVTVKDLIAYYTV